MVIPSFISSISFKHPTVGYLESVCGFSDIKQSLVIVVKLTPLNDSRLLLSNNIQYLGEIEEHLGVTINTVGPDMNVPVDEYEGKVTYGSKRKEGRKL